MVINEYKRLMINIKRIKCAREPGRTRGRFRFSSFDIRFSSIRDYCQVVGLSECNLYNKYNDVNNENNENLIDFDL